MSEASVAQRFTAGVQGQRPPKLLGFMPLLECRRALFLLNFRVFMVSFNILCFTVSNMSRLNLTHDCWMYSACMYIMRVWNLWCLTHCVFLYKFCVLKKNKNLYNWYNYKMSYLVCSSLKKSDFIPPFLFLCPNLDRHFVIDLPWFSMYFNHGRFVFHENHHDYIQFPIQ